VPNNNEVIGPNGPAEASAVVKEYHSIKAAAKEKMKPFLEQR
jgi:hypothetical protein